MATVRSPSSVAARMIRMAISLRFKASSFFISRTGAQAPSIFQRFLDALGEHVHEPLRIETVHPAGNLTAPVYHDRGGNGSDLQLARQTVFEVDIVVPVLFFQKRLDEIAILVRVDGYEFHIAVAVKPALDLLIQRVLHAARSAPGCPE